MYGENCISLYVGIIKCIKFIKNQDEKISNIGGGISF